MVLLNSAFFNYSRSGILLHDLKTLGNKTIELSWAGGGVAVLKQRKCKIA
jgi:hypothetical protein